MTKKWRFLDEPGQQLWWKIALTAVSALCGGLAVYLLFGR